MTKINERLVPRQRALNPDYQLAIKQALAAPMELTPRDYARQIDLFCKRRSIDVVSPCQFVQQQRYEIVLPTLLPYESVRMVMAEMDIVMRTQGAVDLFVMSSSLGIKLIAKLRTAPPILVTQEHPVSYSIESTAAILPSAKELLRTAIAWLDKRDQKAVRSKLVTLVQEIDDLVDDQEARIEHESKQMHDELRPKIKQLEDLMARIEKLDDKGNLPLKLPTIKRHFQERFRMPLSKCAAWTKKITDLLGDPQ